jgi:hypothetical protein
MLRRQCTQGARRTGVEHTLDPESCELGFFEQITKGPWVVFDIIEAEQFLEVLLEKYRLVGHIDRLVRFERLPTADRTLI